MPKWCASQCAILIKLVGSDYVGFHLLEVPRVALAVGVGVRVLGGTYLGSCSSSDMSINRHEGATDLDIPLE